MNKRQKKKFVKRNMLLHFPYATNETLSRIFTHPDSLSINQLYRFEVGQRHISNILAPIHIPGGSQIQYKMTCKTKFNEPNPFKSTYVFTEGE
jgi:hypothetical protein